MILFDVKMLNFRIFRQTPRISIMTKRHSNAGELGERTLNHFGLKSH